VHTCLNFTKKECLGSSGTQKWNKIKYCYVYMYVCAQKYFHTALAPEVFKQVRSN
jgi:hypothetical protein